MQSFYLSDVIGSASRLQLLGKTLLMLRADLAMAICGHSTFSSLFLFRHEFPKTQTPKTQEYPRFKSPTPWWEPKNYHCFTQKFVLLLFVFVFGWIKLVINFLIILFHSRYTYWLTYLERLEKNIRWIFSIVKSWIYARSPTTSPRQTRSPILSPLRSPVRSPIRSSAPSSPARSSKSDRDSDESVDIETTEEDHTKDIVSVLSTQNLY